MLVWQILNDLHAAWEALINQYKPKETDVYKILTQKFEQLDLKDSLTNNNKLNLI